MGEATASITTQYADIAARMREISGEKPKAKENPSTCVCQGWGWLAKKRRDASGWRGFVCPDCKNPAGLKSPL